MTYLELRQKARALWPEYLPNYRHNRTRWLRAVARLGQRWVLLGGDAKWGHGATGSKA